MLSLALEAGNKERTAFRSKHFWRTGELSLKPAYTPTQLLKLHLHWAHSLCIQYVGNQIYISSNLSLKIQVEFHSKAKLRSWWGSTMGSDAVHTFSQSTGCSDSRGMVGYKQHSWNIWTICSFPSYIPVSYLSHRSLWIKIRGDGELKKCGPELHFDYNMYKMKPFSKWFLN